MARLYLVRHGRPAASFADHADPGLAPEGDAQAQAVADRLAPLGPLPMLTSPLRRTRETAAPLEQRWKIMAIVEPGLGEIPTPSDDLAERAAFVRTALGSTWEGLGPRFRSWRDMVVGELAQTVTDSVIVTHFFVINAALGVATGAERTVVAAVDHGSVTVVDVDRHGRVEVVEIGATVEGAGPDPLAGEAGAEPRGETGDGPR